MTFHAGLSGTDIHVPHAYTYSSAAARNAATGFAASDVGKLAYQSDNFTTYRLVNHSPVTWAPVGDATGDMKMFGGASGSLPAGWLLCDGSAVSRSTYASLYALVGTTHGAGDGSTTFCVPDMRRRVPVGVGPAVAGVAATATLTTTNAITLTASAATADRNGNTLKIVVNAAAANPTNTVLVSISGRKTTIITVTPNNGTNNSSITVGLTTAELVSFINTGSVSGKTLTLSGTVATASDVPGALRCTASGGGSALLAQGGEGDGKVGTFAGGVTARSAIALGATGGSEDPDFSTLDLSLMATTNSSGTAQSPSGSASMLSNSGNGGIKLYGPTQTTNLVPLSGAEIGNPAGTGNMQPYVGVNFIIKT